jgi:hypothetical protein
METTNNTYFEAAIQLMLTLLEQKISKIVGKDMLIIGFGTSVFGMTGSREDCLSEQRMGALGEVQFKVSLVSREQKPTQQEYWVRWNPNYPLNIELMRLENVLLREETI